MTNNTASAAAFGPSGSPEVTGQVTVPHPIALTIAGFDPSSGAGVTADLKTFAAHGIFGVACISALTVQSTMGVRAVEPLSGKLIRQTLACIAEDFLLSGVKIGMLGNAEVVHETVSFLESQRLPHDVLVLDPVLRSSSGSPLLDPRGTTLLREELLPRVGWITPNIPELAILSGIGEITRETVPDAALRLKAFAAQRGNDSLNLVVTGGHLAQPDDFLLTASGEHLWFPGERITTNATHGTGCAFSSALLCRLIEGDSPGDAVARAKVYLTMALRLAYPIGKGKGSPNHLYRLSSCD